VSRIDPDLRALQEVRDCATRARAAQKVLAGYSQAEVDRLCKAVADAGASAAKDLSRLAVEETGIGKLHYKILKTLFGTVATWDSIKDEKTVGIVMRDKQRGLVEVATPVGVVACIVPTTNPTSTTFNKSLLALKGRNAAIISPHPRARRTIAECVSVARDAIERVGGPPEALQVLTNPTIESTGALMKHPYVDMILATGGTGLVKAAYSSGKPAYGVGPGNVPCYIDRSADIDAAARGIIASQSFDNGTFCCSEQGLVVDRPILGQLMKALQGRGAHLCNEAEVKKLEVYCLRGGHMNADVVGLDPSVIAERSGFSVPKDTTLLMAPQNGVGPQAPLAVEILCPLVSLHAVENWEEGCKISLAMLHADGLGHTVAVWARDERVLEAWMLEKPANRIIVNGPSSMGAVGYSTNLAVSVSLGCGPQAGNITSDNITAKHLVNIKRVAFPRDDWEAMELRDHRRASELSGDTAPRGSGLPGDPGVRLGKSLMQGQMPGLGGGVPDAAVASNWRGNPSVDVASLAAGGSASSVSSAGNVASSNPPAPRSGAGIQSKVGIASKSAPSFTEAGASRTRASIVASPAPFRPGDGGLAQAPVQVPRPSPGSDAPRVSAAGASAARSYTGHALSTDEIEGILAQAGASCPLGPCQGCPHHDVRSGACGA
jgi:acetaldehyde dehydrogenase (acetylating)